jgi:hypothetical protein
MKLTNDTIIDVSGNLKTMIETITSMFPSDRNVKSLVLTWSEYDINKKVQNYSKHYYIDPPTFQRNDTIDVLKNMRIDMKKSAPNKRKCGYSKETLAKKIKI